MGAVIEKLKKVDPATENAWCKIALNVELLIPRFALRIVSPTSSRKAIMPIDGKHDSFYLSLFGNTKAIIAKNLKCTAE